MTKDLNRGATDFLRERWAAYVERRLLAYRQRKISELLGDIKPPQNSQPSCEAPVSSGVSSLAKNSGCVSRARLSGEGV